MFVWNVNLGTLFSSPHDSHDYVIISCEISDTFVTFKADKNRDFKIHLVTRYVMEMNQTLQTSARWDESQDFRGSDSKGMTSHRYGLSYGSHLDWQDEFILSQIEMND